MIKILNLLINYHIQLSYVLDVYRFPQKTWIFAKNPYFPTQPEKPASVLINKNVYQGPI